MMKNILFKALLLVMIGFFAVHFTVEKDNNLDTQEIASNEDTTVHRFPEIEPYFEGGVQGLC